MANTRKEYRLEVFQLNSTTVDFTINSSGLKGPPSLGGQRISPLEGRSESLPTQVLVLDPNSTFTEQLSNAGGHGVLMNRRAQVLTQVGSSTESFNVAYVGRITDIADHVEHYTLTLLDERHKMRISTIFGSLSWPSSSNATPSTAKFGGTYIIPPKIVGDYRGYTVPAQPGFGFSTEEDSRGPPSSFIYGCRVVRTVDWDGQAVLDALEADLKTDLPESSDAELGASSSAGNFIFLRARGQDGNDYEVHSIRSVSTIHGGYSTRDTRAFRRGEILEAIETIAETTLTHYDVNVTAWIVAASSDADAAAPVLLWMPGRHPDNLLPLHIGGRWGMDQWDLAETIYKEVGVEYSTSALEQLRKRWPGYPQWWRITGPQNAARWLEDNLYKPYGVVPFIDNDGKLAPRRVLVPDGDLITDVSNLPEFGSTDVAMQPTWQQSNQEMVTSIQFTYEDEKFSQTGFYERWVEWVQPKFPWEPLKPVGHADEIDWAQGFSCDLIRSFIVPLPTSSGGQWYEYTANADIGRVERGIHLSGVRKPLLHTQVRAWLDPTKKTYPSPQQSAKMIATHTFARYGDGPIHGNLVPLTSATPASSGLQPGDFVRIAVGTYPNIGDQARSTSGRVVQLLSRVASLGGPKYETLDAGPALNPPSAITATLSCSTGDPHHSVTVTVSGLATDASWIAELITSSSTPSTDPEGVFVVHGASTSVLTARVSQLPSAEFFFLRARQLVPQRMASAWSTFNGPIQTEPLTGPSGVTVVTSGKRATVTWTNGESIYPIDVYLGEGLTSSGAVPVARLDYGSTTYELIPLVQDTTHWVSVHHIDSYGGVSTADSTTFQTSTAAVQAPTFGTLELVQGTTP